MISILIADDERLICGVLRDFFQESQGMLVRCAHTGPEAARMLTEGHYDLALIGVPLAGSFGFDLAALAASKNTGVLLMTGHSVLRLTMQQFAFPYLGKPFTLVALGAAVERLMGDHARALENLETSLKRLRANGEALARGMEQSDRMLDSARARQQAGYWDLTVARVKDTLPNYDSLNS